MGQDQTTTAVIFAAGRGTRLDRSDTPKPLVKIGNKPMILWNIEQLQDSGVSTIYIVVGHRADEIKKYLTNNPHVTAIINYIENTDSTDKGLISIIPKISGVISESAYWTMADLIIHDNPYQYFDNSSASLTTLIDARPENMKSSGALSCVHINSETPHVKNISRGATDHHGVEIGIYHVPAEALSECVSIMQDNKSLSSFGELLLILANKEKLHYKKITNGEWFDINTPATKIRAEIYYRERQHKQKISDHSLQYSRKNLPIVNSFHRVKSMNSNIIIQNGIIRELAEYNIIPQQGIDSPHILLTDETVDQHYGDLVLKQFRDQDIAIKKIVIPAGEESKRFEQFKELTSEILSYSIDKNSYIISLGGGVINNIAGLLASSIYRGVGLIHIPTSSMAQVDAAIDFKQAINSEKGKNLIGSYYPADSIIIDPKVLHTLDKRHLANGFAESIKHGLTQEKNFCDYLLANAHKLDNTEVLEQIVKKTVELKVPLLNGDTNNDYNEMLPQYGHSIGHAIEHLSAYNLLHGEAVAIGMCLTAQIANILGVCDESVVETHYNICEKYNLPTSVPEYMTGKDICKTIRYDKHYLKGNPQMGLITDIGNVWQEQGTYGIPIDYNLIERAVEINKKRALI